MVTALFMKSFHDLGKKKARSTFTILTIVLGVMGMALFAVNPLAESTIDDEVEEQNLFNLRFALPDTEIPDNVTGSLLSIENVENMEYFHVYRTEMIKGGGREDVRLVGIEDLDCMKVDRVISGSDSLPGEGEAMSEEWNSKNDLFSGGKDSTIDIFDENGVMVKVSISGKGKSLAQRDGLYDSSGEAVFYMNIEDVRSISNSSGINLVSMTLESTDENDIEWTIEEIWAVLRGVDGIDALDQTPQIREEGEWPGGEFLEYFMTIMYILTVIAIVCSVFFIYNTMNTIISEQKKEVAMMKAVGATKVQIFRSFITTSFIMGSIGTIIGTILGTFLSYALLIYFGSLMGFSASFSIHFLTVGASIFGGVMLVILSSLPAIIKALRVRTREGMEDTGLSSNYGKGVIDRILLKSTWMPRTVQLGFRNSARRKGRSIATVLQIALAIGVFMGLVSFGYSLGEELSGTIDNIDYDIILGSNDNGGYMDVSTAEDILVVEGVDSVEPHLDTRFTMGSMEVNVMGYRPDTEMKLHEKTLVRGEWLPQESDIHAAVIGEQLSNYASIEVGDTISVMTPTGPADIEIIGVDSDFYYMGMILYMPLDTVQNLTGQEGMCTAFHMTTVDDSRSTVDRVAADIEDQLRANGMDVETDKKYRIVEGVVSQNQSIVNMMAATSVIIILISLVGLTSNLTMNILDRTREIGVMRCIGSVASSIRTIFTTEVVTLSVIGLMIGIPFGYVFARIISYLIDSMIDWEIGIRYPMLYIILGVVIVIAGAIGIAQFPILRATRIRPGDALRYQ